MRESDADLAELQQLLDRSAAAAGEHLRSIFDDEHGLRAAEVVAALDGIFEVHLATVTRAGAPLVAPIDGIFYRGRLWFGCVAGSVRGRLIHRDSRVSASYANADVGVIAHGRAHEVSSSDPLFAGYDALMRELYIAQYGPGWTEWFEGLQWERAECPGFVGFIEPRVMFARRSLASGRD